MKRVAFALLAVCVPVAALAAQDAPAPPASISADKTGSPPAHAMTHPTPACAEAKVDCAMTAVPAFARDGRLWVAFSVGKTIYAAASSDNGKSFSAPTAVATVADGVVDAHGDARPKIVALHDGSLLATYTTRPDKQMIGTIFTSRSTDGGKTFSTPQPLLSEGGQRFDSIVVNRKGRIYAGWLDKTHALKAKAEGKEFAGSGVAFGYSDDRGKTFNGKSILIDHACECCRMSGALDKDGTPVFVWRQVLDGGVRDHMVAKLSPDAAQATATRVSDDDWSINSCPHHGPSIAIDASGAWHVVWFTKGKNRQGLFYARSLDEGKSFSQPEQFGEDSRAPGHPTLIATKDRLYRVWKEFDGTMTTIATQMSRDNGKSWSAPRAITQTTDASDHPELIAHKGAAFLSWLTHKEGYRLLPLPRDEKSAAAAR